MGIYQRPDSPFWYYHLEGTTIRKNTKVPIDGGTPEQTAANRALAKQVYAAEMGDLARGQHRLTRDRQTITFAKFRAWFAEHVTAKKRSAYKEASMLDQLGAVFDPLRLDQITTKLVLEWQTTSAKDISPGTVNRYRTVLRSLLDAAVAQGYLETNPAGEAVADLRVPERETRLLEPDEETRLLAACSIEERAIILCALDTLQRLSNVAGLKRAQDHGGYITVLNPKVTGYKVPVSSRLRAALDALPKAGPFYFPSMQGKDDTARSNAMQRMFRRLMTAAELPQLRRDGGLSFHCLRHTGASRMLARGVDIKTVQEIGGWRSIEVLLKYLHPTAAHKRAAVEMIGREPSVNADVPPSPPQSPQPSGSIH